MAVVRMPAKTKKKPTKTAFTEFEKFEEDRKRSLRFDANALADFEQETGMGFAQMIQQKALFGSARALLWAGLKHEDRALTIEQVGKLIQEWLQDPDNEESRNINDLLMIVLAAGVEQGAFGKVKQDIEKDELEIEELQLPEGAKAKNDSAVDGEVIDPNLSN